MMGRVVKEFGGDAGVSYTTRFVNVVDCDLHGQGS